MSLYEMAVSHFVHVETDFVTNIVDSIAVMARHGKFNPSKGFSEKVKQLAKRRSVETMRHFEAKCYMLENSPHVFSRVRRDWFMRSDEQGELIGFASETPSGSYILSKMTTVDTKCLPVFDVFKKLWQYTCKNISISGNHWYSADGEYLFAHEVEKLVSKERQERARLFAEQWRGHETSPDCWDAINKENASGPIFTSTRGRLCHPAEQLAADRVETPLVQYG